MLRGTTAQGTEEDYKYRKMYTILENEGLSGFTGDSVPFICEEMIPYFERIQDYEKCKFLQKIVTGKK